MSVCSERGRFANPHLGEFLTPWISPLDMFWGRQRYASCYVIISFGCREIITCGDRDSNRVLSTDCPHSNPIAKFLASAKSFESPSISIQFYNSRVEMHIGHMKLRRTSIITPDPRP